MGYLRKKKPAIRRKPADPTTELDEDGALRVAPQTGLAGPSESTASAAPAPHLLRQLQREAGNRAVAQLLGELSLQRDLKLNDGPSEAVGHLQQQLNATGSATPRLSVNGRFDTPTETAVKVFETNQAIKPATGVVTDALQKMLDAAAPLVSRGDQKTVEVGPGDTQVRFPGEVPHPMIRTGAKGPAVKEAQERINNSPTMTDAARKARKTATDVLAVDGAFGPRTRAAAVQFQRDKKLSPDGVIGPNTWKELEKAGAASQGRVEFEWREEVEGVTNVGGRAKYQWRIDPARLLISAKVQFVPKAKGVDAKVGDWLQEIKDIWGTFKAVNKKNPAENLKVDFEVERGAGDFKVNVLKKLEKDGTPTRSDAANWNVLDPRRGLASHEFGHLLGLADEYNRDEGQYVATTGEEVEVGDPTGDVTTADTLAASIKGAMPLTDDGTILAGIVTTALGDKQGGFSRFVRERYAAKFGTDVAKDIQAAFAVKGFPGFHGPKTDAITPFLYSSGSIMGTMVTAGPGPHDHPVEPRHIRPFVAIISQERSLQSGQAEQWEPKRR